MRALTLDDLPALLRGSQFLGGGGGGYPDTYVPLIVRALERRGPVPMLDVDELPDEALCVPIGMIGSSSISSELMAAGDEVERLLAVIRQRYPQQPAALSWFEAAGGNGLFPLLAAAVTGLPLVDCDGMGRAFSQLTQTTFRAAGQPLAPLILAGRFGDVVVIERESSRVEQVARALVEPSGGWLIAAWHVQTAASLASDGIAGAGSALLRIGEASLTARPAEPQHLARALGGRHLGSGRLIEMTGARPGREVELVVRTEPSPERLLRIVGRDESLLVLQDGQVVATVPDVIVLINRDGGTPVDLERARPGLFLDVVVLPAPRQWLAPDALPRVDPRAHGYDIDPVLLGKGRDR